MQSKTHADGAASVKTARPGHIVPAAAPLGDGCRPSGRIAARHVETAALVEERGRDKVLQACGGGAKGSLAGRGGPAQAGAAAGGDASSVGTIRRMASLRACMSMGLAR